MWYTHARIDASATGSVGTALKDIACALEMPGLPVCSQSPENEGGGPDKSGLEKRTE